MNAVTVKDQLQEPVKGLGTACSVAPVAATRGQGNECLLRRYSLKGCRHDVVTREHSSGGLGRIRVSVRPKANRCSTAVIKPVGLIVTVDGGAGGTIWPVGSGTTE